MWLAVGILCTVQILVAGAGILWARGRIQGIEARIQGAIRDFTTAPDPQTPSPLAQTAQALAQLMGRELAQSLKHSLFGQAGNVAKQEKALVQDAIQDQAEAQSPMLGLLLDNLGPRVKNRLLKNPSAIQAVMGLFQNLGSSGSSGSNGSNGSGSVRDRLRGQS